MNALPSATASTSDIPRASPAVIAAASESPPPWVCGLANPTDRNSWPSPEARQRRSTYSGWARPVVASRCPPLTSTAAAPIACRAAAASWAEASSTTFTSARSAISSRFGVTRVARGSSSVRTASRASSASSGLPCIEAATGSTTKGTPVPTALRRPIPTASHAPTTASMISRDASIPVFAASTPMSPATVRIWAATTSTGTSWNPVTPSEFCTVTAVTATDPWTSHAATARTSAVMPAPPPESVPAMVRATGGRRADSVLLIGIDAATTADRGQTDGAVTGRSVRWSVGQLGGHREDVDHRLPPQHRHRQGAPDGAGEQAPLEALGVGDGLAVGGDHEVAGPQPGLGRGRPGDDGGDPQPRRTPQPGRDLDRQRRGGPDDPEVAAPHAALPAQRGEDLAGRGRHRDGEPEPDPRDGGVDPDDVPRRVGQGPAGVAGVQRRVGLDHVLDDAARAAVAGRQRAAEGAHDAGGPAAREPQRGADGHHELPHA